NEISYRVETGSAVVVLAHSQGNLYVNSAYNGLDSSTVKPYVRVVSVATPSAYAPFVYVTRNDDLVVGVIPSALPGNVAATSAGFSDIPGHYMNPAYLSDPATFSALYAAVVTQVTAVPAPPGSSYGAGFLSATLTWGAEPDLDLHAYEPGGSHVWYSDQTGESGVLDFDDTSSYGPENYVVDCSTIQYGTYLLGVAYYFGSGPETAVLRISAGTQVQTITRTLHFDSSRPNDPYIMASVLV
ncbi:unnamed protein product, partial [Ectocarpus fasciculatus]